MDNTRQRLRQPQYSRLSTALLVLCPPLLHPHTDARRTTRFATIPLLTTPLRPTASRTPPLTQKQKIHRSERQSVRFSGNLQLPTYLREDRLFPLNERDIHPHCPPYHLYLSKARRNLRQAARHRPIFPPELGNRLDAAPHLIRRRRHWTTSPGSPIHRLRHHTCLIPVPPQRLRPQNKRYSPRHDQYGWYALQKARSTVRSGALVRSLPRLVEHIRLLVLQLFILTGALCTGNILRFLVFQLRR